MEIMFGKIKSVLNCFSIGNIMLLSLITKNKIYIIGTSICFIVEIIFFINRKRECEKLAYLEINGFTRKYDIKNIQYETKNLWTRGAKGKRFHVNIRDMDLKKTLCQHIDIYGKKASTDFEKILKENTIEVLIDREDLDNYFVRLDELADRYYIYHGEKIDKSELMIPIIAWVGSILINILHVIVYIAIL